MFSTTLIHIPHASLNIPEEELPFYTTPFLEREKLVMTDRYCDDLFACDAEMITAPVSRLVVDMERFRNDEDEEMARVGMGAVYTGCSDGSVLRTVTDEHRRLLLEHYYDEHHRRLAEAVSRRLSAFGRCLIIDGHSFYPVPLPYEKDRSPDRPDICIGTDPYHTPPALAETAVHEVEDMGYTVEINSPFSGSIVPMAWYGKDSRVASIMIEVNRRLYMSENGDKLVAYNEIKTDIGRLVHKLVDVNEICRLPGDR